MNNHKVVGVQRNVHNTGNLERMEGIEDAKKSVYNGWWMQKKVTTRTK